MEDNHYDESVSSPSKRAKVAEEDDYDAALMNLNDTEQLRFLADQLKPTEESVEQDSQSNHDPSHQMVSNGETGVSSITAQPYSTTFTPITYADLPLVDAKITDPLHVLRIKSLPILDNLSTQILNTLGRGAYMDAISIATQPETDQGQAFQILMSLFEQTKTIYASEDAFLSAKQLGLNINREFSVIVQKTNLATFVSAVFGAAKVGFFHLNENFLDTFVVENGKLLKPQGALFLDLKTQAYISAMGQVEQSQKEILDDLFPEDIDKILLTRKINSKVLAPSEVDFVSRCKRRREHLANMDPKEDLSLKYSWLAFVRDLSEYISKNSRMILTGKSGKANEDRKEVLRKVSSISMEVRPDEPVTAPEVTQLQTSTATGNSSSSQSNSRPPYYQRRPWTSEEEEALMAGLNTVQGPHWAQILELYGPGGRISEVLKDRNQVQLKDKARNLKMFFLKTGAPMPEVLKFVTGDVKSRTGKRYRKKAAVAQAFPRVNSIASPATTQPTQVSNVLSGPVLPTTEEPISNISVSTQDSNSNTDNSLVTPNPSLESIQNVNTSSSASVPLEQPGNTNVDTSNKASNTESIFASTTTPNIEVTNSSIENSGNTESSHIDQVTDPALISLSMQGSPESSAKQSLENSLTTTSAESSGSIAAVSTQATPEKADISNPETSKSEDHHQSEGSSTQNPNDNSSADKDEENAHLMTLIRQVDEYLESGK